MCPPRVTIRTLLLLADVIYLAVLPSTHAQGPVFTQRTYNGSCVENTPVDATDPILRVSATHPDSNAAMQLTYAMENNPWFRIDNKGEIRVKSPVDAEDPNVPRILTYSITVADNGSPPITATATVSIQVVDYNEDRPTFDLPFYSVTLRDGDPSGRVVARPHAEDNDRDSRLSYRFLLPETFLNIDSATGEITTNTTIIMKEIVALKGSDDFNIQVRADDGLYITTVRVLILVVDENRFAPEFTPVHYNVSVEENLSGVDLITVLATDDKEIPVQRVAYSLLNQPGQISGLMSINSDTGTITLVTPLDREGPLGDSLTQLVLAEDDGNPGPVMTSTATVVISVLDVNDNPPRYSVTSHNLILSQTYTSRETHALPRATDRDIGPNAVIEYELSGGGGGEFTLDRQTSTLTTATDCGPDCVKTVNCFWKKITVTARDPGKASFTDSLDVNIVLITPGSTVDSISDISGLVDCSQAPTPNDNDPVFPQTVYEVYVYENITYNTLILTVSASDDDRGNSGQLVYSGSSPYFAVDPTGGVVTIRELDYETASERRICFDVTATDNGVPPRSSLTTVCVNVMNMNDNQPVFTSQRYTANVIDADPVGTPVVTVSATDKDAGDSLTYRLLGRNEYFGIDSQTGEITVTKIIDVTRLVQGSTDTSVSMTVQVTDGVFTNSAIVRVNLVDRNRFPPEFTMSRYRGSVEENRAGVTLVTVTATDDKEAPSQNVTYGLASQVIPGLMSINSDTGTITLVTPLDREGPLGDSLTQLVLAEDDGNPGPVMTSTATVLITVLDVNDNPPRYSVTSHNLILSQTYTSGERHSLPTATDLDIGPNAVIEYELSGGGGGEFTLDRQTSALTTATDCGPDCVKTVNCFWKKVTVTALNPGMTSFVDTLDVNIILTRPGSGLNSISDISGLVDCSQAPTPNDNDPVFPQTVYEVYVYENITYNTLILTVSAGDADRGNSGQLVYSGSSPYFAVDPSGGVVTIRELDYETASERRICFHVTATDNGVPPRSSTTTVCVNVMNINDNQPVFTSQRYTANVHDADPVGTPVVTVSATDKDAGDSLTYRLLGQNEYFGINSQTGEITVTKIIDVTTLLQGKTGTSVTLTVQVTDGTFSSNVTLTVSLVDRNKFPPEFTMSQYRGSVEENRAGVTLVTVTATDDKEDPSQKVTYSLGSQVSPGQLSINSDTGMITLVRPLDREGPLGDSLTQLVLAQDDGNPGPVMTSTATVVITVLDVNDNPPRYSVTSHNLILPQDFSSGERYVLPTATDADIGQNAVIQYRLYEGGDGMFTVNGVTGVLTTVSDCGPECLKTATCFWQSIVILAYNPNNLRMNSTLQVQLILALPGVNSITDTAGLGDCSETRYPNDNTPSFPEDQYETSLDEGTPANHVLLTVSASDGDRGESGKVVYTDDSPYFAIRPSGEIVTTRELDYETVSERRICFNVVATDSGVPPRSSTTTVCVNVNNVNDNPPVFSPALYTISVNHGDTTGTLLQRLTVADKDGVANLTFELSSPDKYFFVNNTSGQLYVRETINMTDLLQRSPSGSFELMVGVTDGKFTDSATVTVLLQRSNDHGPIFTRQIYNTSVDEEKEGVSLVTVSARDNDVPRQPLRYQILVSPLSGKFSINSTTGEVKLVQKLDRETILTGIVDVIVVVSDNGQPPPIRSSTATVRVHVNDVNDHAPKFPMEIYDLQMIQNFSSDSSFRLPKATDLDIGDTIRYALSDNAKSLFTIDEGTGMVTTRESCNQSCIRQDDCHYMNFTVWAYNPDRPEMKSPIIVNVLLLTPSSTGRKTDLVSCDSAGLPNLYSPRFSQKTYLKWYHDSVTPLTVILIVAATDDDSGQNGQIEYFLRGTSDFGINQYGGIFTRRNMDYKRLEDRKLCMLAVARDKGKPPKEDAATVCLYLNETSTDRLRFHKNAYFTTVLDGTQAGVILTRVFAIGPDRITDVVYTIWPDNIYFQINGRNVTVSVTVNRTDILLNNPNSAVELRVAARQGEYFAEAPLYISVFPAEETCPGVIGDSYLEIGLLIAGWLLTIIIAVVVFVCYRRRMKKETTSRRSSSYSSSFMNNKASSFYGDNKAESDITPYDRSLYMNSTLTLPRQKYLEDNKYYEPFPVGKPV